VSNKESPPPNDPATRDPIAALLQLAGPRPEVSAERTSRVQLAVREEWLDTLRLRQRKTRRIRTTWVLAAAAVVAAGVGLSFLSRSPVPPTAPPVEVASVQTLIGEVNVVRSSTDQGPVTSPVRNRETIRTGEILETDIDGLAGLDLGDGRLLRVNHSTRFWFESPTVIRLETGTLYIDAGIGAVPAPDIAVETLMGTVYEIGTQFEVMQTTEDLRIRVREGAVDLERDNQRYRAEVGSQLLVDNGGKLSRKSVPVYGPDWNWILELSPRFELEGKTLDQFLLWVSRETGWAMHLSDRASAENTLSATLHGTLEGLRADEALEAVLPTCDLKYSVDEGVVQIDLDS